MAASSTSETVDSGSPTMRPRATTLPTSASRSGPWSRLSSLTAAVGSAGTLILSVQPSCAPVLEPLLLRSSGMVSVSKKPLSVEVSVPQTLRPRLNGLELLTCFSSALTVSPRGMTSSPTPASPSMRASSSVQLPVRSACLSHAPSPPSPHAPRSSRSSSAANCRTMLVVIFRAKVGDELLPTKMPQRVLQLHELNEQVVLGVEAGGGHRALEEERQPLL